MNPTLFKLVQFLGIVISIAGFPFFIHLYNDYVWGICMGIALTLLLFAFIYDFKLMRNVLIFLVVLFGAYLLTASFVIGQNILTT